MKDSLAQEHIDASQLLFTMETSIRVVKRFQQRFDFDYLYGAINVQSGVPVFAHMPSVTCEIT